MGALCLSTAVLRHAPTHVRAPAPRKKHLSAPRGSALRQKTRHCPKPLTFSEMDIIIIKHTKSACLAQPVEHAAVNRSVGGSSPSTGAIERNRIAVSFLFLSFSSNLLTLFSPCTTPACRSVGENMLFRRALRSLRGSSPLAGAIVAARRTSQHLAQQRGVFACMPALNPTENSFGGGPDLCPTKHTFCGDPGHYPTENTFGGDPSLMPSFLVTAENVFFNSI